MSYVLIILVTFSNPGIDREFYFQRFVTKVSCDKAAKEINSLDKQWIHKHDETDQRIFAFCYVEVE